VEAAGRTIKYNGCIIVVKDDTLDPRKIILEIYDFGSKVSITYKLPLTIKKAKELANAILEKIKN